MEFYKDRTYFLSFRPRMKRKRNESGEIPLYIRTAKLLASAQRGANASLCHFD